MMTLIRYITLFMVLQVLPDMNLSRIKQPVAVVISADTDVSENVDRRVLLEMYTLRKHSWDSGLKIKIADYKGDSELRESFYNFLKVNITDIRRIWLKEQFTGRSIPPQIVKGEDEMIELIRSKPGTVGYLRANTVPQDFRILFIVDD